VVEQSLKALGNMSTSIQHFRSPPALPEFPGIGDIFWTERRSRLRGRERRRLGSISPPISTYVNYHHLLGRFSVFNAVADEYSLNRWI
jgi:hypothetical protein